MTLPELAKILDQIKYKQCVFAYGVTRDNVHHENGITICGISVREAFWLQVQYPVVEKGIHRMAKGRRWIIETDSTPWQIVATAFKACLTIEEHETRESFLYKGAAVFYPHHDLDELVEIRLQHAGSNGTSEAEDKV